MKTALQKVCKQIAPVLIIPKIRQEVVSGGRSGLVWLVREYSLYLDMPGRVSGQRIQPVSGHARESVWSENTAII